LTRPGRSLTYSDSLPTSATCATCTDRGEAEVSLPDGFAAAFPYAAEMAVAVTHGGALGPCDDDDEFEFALDFILDGLQRLRRSRPA
jgi:hypothetical protein